MSISTIPTLIFRPRSSDVPETHGGSIMNEDVPIEPDLNSVNLITPATQEVPGSTGEEDAPGDEVPYEEWRASQKQQDTGEFVMFQEGGELPEKLPSEVPTPEKGRNPDRRLSQGGDIMSVDDEQSPLTHSRSDDGHAIFSQSQEGSVPSYPPPYDPDYEQASSSQPRSDRLQFSFPSPPQPGSEPSTQARLEEASGLIPSAAVRARPLPPLPTYPAPGALPDAPFAAYKPQPAVSEDDVEMQNAPIQNFWGNARVEEGSVANTPTQATTTSWRHRAKRFLEGSTSWDPSGAEPPNTPAQGNARAPSTRRGSRFRRVLELRRGESSVVSPAPLQADGQATTPPTQSGFRFCRGQKRSRQADAAGEDEPVDSEQRSTTKQKLQWPPSTGGYAPGQESTVPTSPLPSSTLLVEASQPSSDDYVPDHLMEPFMEILESQGEVNARKFLRRMRSRSAPPRVSRKKGQGITNQPTTYVPSADNLNNFLSPADAPYTPHRSGREKHHGQAINFESIFDPPEDDPYGGSLAFRRLKTRDGAVIAEDPGVYGITEIRNAMGIRVARGTSSRAYSDDNQTPTLNKQVIDIHIDDDLAGAAEVGAPVEKFRRLMSSSPLASRSSVGVQDGLVSNVGLGLGTLGGVTEGYAVGGGDGDGDGDDGDVQAGEEEYEVAVGTPPISFPEWLEDDKD